MKKLVVTCSLLIACIAANAQIENLRLGFNLSPFVSWLVNDDPEIRRTGSNVGLQAGAIAEYYLNENMMLTSGLGLAFNRGGTLKYETGGNFFPNSRLSDNLLNSGDKPLPDGVKIKYKLQYLEIPLGIRFRTNEKGYLRYFAEAPVFTMGFRTGARANLEGQELDSQRENISGDVPFFNFSVGGGAGVEYAITEEISGVFGLYYTAGLSDITSNAGYTAEEVPGNNPFNPDDDYLTKPENSRARLRSVTLRLSLMF